MIADTLAKIKNKIQDDAAKDEPNEPAENDDSANGKETESEKTLETAVVDIQLNDENLEIASSTVDKNIGHPLSVPKSS